MKKILFVLMVLLLCGCSSQNTAEITALQTQVADLSAANLTSNEATTESDFVAARSDESAFVLEFTEKLQAKGWAVNDVADNHFGVTTPNGGIYLVQYDYETEEVSRVMIYSIWTGAGTSNLEQNVLSIVNQANDEQFLAKISVDSDGDFWLETLVTFGKQLDVNYFCDYVEWFESNESAVLMGYFQDYLK